MANNDNLKISFVVPVYNTAPYLRKCVDSLIKQTYSNIEIILVDDGSTDNSGAICEEYSALDTRVRVIHKPNSGLVSARKTGVLSASGEYIAQVDGDDWVRADFCETLVRLVNETQADVISFGLQENCKGKEIKRTDSIAGGLYTKDQFVKEIYPVLLYSPVSSASGLMPNVVTKLVRADILKQSQLSVPDRISFGEDQLCTVRTVQLANSLFVTDEALYYYERRDDSISRKPVDFESCKSLFVELYAIYSADSQLTAFIDRLWEYAYFVLLLKQFDVFLSGPLQNIPYGDISHCRIVLYGAGTLGQEIYAKFDHQQIALWVDRGYEQLRKLLPVQPVHAIMTAKYDCILVAITDYQIAVKVKQDLIHMGIANEKIRLLCQLSGKELGGFMMEMLRKPIHRNSNSQS